MKKPKEPMNVIYDEFTGESWYSDGTPIGNTKRTMSQSTHSKSIIAYSILTCGVISLIGIVISLIWIVITVSAV